MIVIGGGGWFGKVLLKGRYWSKDLRKGRGKFGGRLGRRILGRGRFEDIGIIVSLLERREG